MRATVLGVMLLPLMAGYLEITGKLAVWHLARRDRRSGHVFEFYCRGTSQQNHAAAISRSTGARRTHPLSARRLTQVYVDYSKKIEENTIIK